MKRKSKHAYPRKIKEFRYHSVTVMINGKKTKKIRHPAYAFLAKGNVLVYVIITHSTKVEFIELRSNPNPKDNRRAYRTKQFYADTLDSFGRREKGWEMNPIDDAEIRKGYEKSQTIKNDDSADQDDSWLLGTGGLAPTNHRQY